MNHRLFDVKGVDELLEKETSGHTQLDLSPIAITGSALTSLHIIQH